MTGTRHLPPSVLERFHDRYGTLSLVTASPKTLAEVVASDRPLRVRFLAACLSSRHAQMRAWIGRAAVDTPYVYYSVLEACCQRGVFRVSRILALQAFCVQEDESVVFLENLCARGCLAAAQWWRGCTGASTSQTATNLVSLVATNGQWRVWEWLQTIERQILHDQQRWAFHSACLGGQVEFARRLWRHYHQLDPTLDRHRLHRSLWSQIAYLHAHPLLVPERPYLSDLVAITNLLCRLVPDQYLGPYLISSQLLKPEWKRLTKAQARQLRDTYRQTTGDQLPTEITSNLCRDADLDYQFSLDAWMAQVRAEGINVLR